MIEYKGGGFFIQYYMKLLEQILNELGADTLKSFSIIPDFGGYFRSVKGVSEYSPQKITLLLKKSHLIIEGENLTLGKYFEEDLFIKGKITGVKLD